MKSLILAGGLGTRLKPFSYTGAKQLVPIANKPVLHYVIEDLANVGIKDIGIIVGYTADRIDKIKKSVEDGSKWNVKITLIEQDAPRGIAHAVGIAEEFMGGDDFVVYLGDNILKGGINEFVKDFKEKQPDASLLLCEVEHPEKYGVAVLNPDGEVIDVEEKPQKPKSNLAITGIYIFNSEIFNAIKQIKPGKGGELQITDAINILVKSKKHKVLSYVVTGWWDDTGTSDALLRANHLILSEIKASNEGVIEKDAKILGNVKIGKGAVIKEGCYLKGPIIIGKNCVIGPKSYIGPYTSVGDGTIIIGGEIESSIVLDNAYIRYNEKIVDSLIGKNAKIVSDNSLPKGHKFFIGDDCEVKQ